MKTTIKSRQTVQVLNLFIVSVIFMTSLPLSVQAQKTINQRLKANNEKHYVFATDDHVEVLEWSLDYPLIKTTIICDEIHEETLSYIISQDIFLLDLSKEENHTLITAPNLHKVISVNKNDLEWSIAYTIYTPKDFTFDIKPITHQLVEAY